jgi:peptidoglycan/xylan/chitin deacetylase (PgdA/CDA1 family)
MIKRLLRNVTVTAGRHISPEALISVTKEQVVMPFYHLVAAHTPPHIRYLYEAKNLKQFEEDLDFLLRHFRAIGLQDLYSHALGEKYIKKPSFFLSFDDGLSSFYDVVAPMLERKGVPATCFLNPSFVDNKDIMYRYKASLIIERLSGKNITDSGYRNIWELFGKREVKSTLLDKKYSDTGLLDEIAVMAGVDFKAYLAQERPYMTGEQILNLKQRGFEFGAHSMDHPHFGTIGMEEQVCQAVESVRWVQEFAGSKTAAFAFPFTDHGVHRDVMHRIREQVGSDLLMFGTAGLKKPKASAYFQRISMEVPKASAGDILKHEYIYYILKNIIGRA